jgi:hypothetical protein
MIKKTRALLGLAITLAGAGLNADLMVDWMRHSNI